VLLFVWGFSVKFPQETTITEKMMTHGGQIGDITWHRVVEAEGPEFDISFLLPDATPEAMDADRPWMEPRFLDPGTNKLLMTTQSYVLRDRHHTILVDSCVGNDKERRF